MRKIWLMAAFALTATPALAQGGGMAARLAAVDLNHDGAITRTEAQQARAAMFVRTDTNGDGYLSEAERNAAANGAGGRGPGLGEADTNNDGRVSRDEMMNQPYRMFDRLDGNNDGVISSQEMQAVRRFGG